MNAGLKKGFIYRKPALIKSGQALTLRKIISENIFL